jgi:hypothetical protein
MGVESKLPTHRPRPERPPGEYELEVLRRYIIFHVTQRKYGSKVQHLINLRPSTEANAKRKITFDCKPEHAAASSSS